MAIRNIVKEEDDILAKVCRPVEVFDKRLWALLDDMAETMKNANGVGIAAPQVGILKRVCLIYVEDRLIELINPEIIDTRGTQNAVEGCLSCPGQFGITERPAYVKVVAQNRKGKKIITDGEELKARALCHEIDHLDGILFKTHVIEEVHENTDEGVKDGQ